MNIEKLLRKKSWTGAELGRLEIYNALHIYGEALQGNPNPKGIISPANFKKSLDALNTPQDLRDYNNYIYLHEWLTEQTNQAYAHQQQALLNFQTIFNSLNCATVAEKTYQYIEQLPYIITEKQLKDKRAEVKASLITEKPELSIANLIAFAVEFLTDDYKSNPRKKNALKPLKKVLEAQTITAQHILNSYNEIWGNGAFIFPDGRRSDTMSTKEWLEAVEPVLDDLERKYRDGQITAAVCGCDMHIVKEASSVAKAILASYGVVWECDEAPKSLNKWALLLEDEFIESWYQGLKGEPEAQENQRQALSALKEEYPELLGPVLKYIDGYFKGVSSTPCEDWTKPLYSWKEIYSVDFAGFVETDIDTSIILWDGNYRALRNGIAIYQPVLSPINKDCIDKNGHYKAPELTKEIEPLMLDAFFTDSKFYADSVDAIDGARDLLLDSYYFLLGYNKILDLIEELLKVEGLEVLRVKAYGLEERAETFNFLSKNLYKQINDTFYEEKLLKEKKLEVMNRFFKPLHFESLQLPEEAIEATKQAIYSFKGFKEDAYNPITLLCIRHENGREA